MKKFDREQMLADADLGSPKARFHILIMTTIVMALMFGGIAFFLYR